VKEGAWHLLAYQKDSIARKTNRVIALKQGEIEHAQSTCGGICESIRATVEYVRELARARALPTRADGIASIRGVLDSVIAAEEKATVQQHCHGGPKGQKSFARAAKESYDREMRAKEEELEQTIFEARKRRLKLEVDLDAALEQIRRLHGDPSDEDVTGGFDHSKYDFEASSPKLDETMSQLSLRRRPE
jgi:hypothetical protein